MAVRNDFTAGEVLAAADLNDTFGAKLNLAGGKVLQIVRATDATRRTTTSTSLVDGSISVTITPQRDTSAILLIWSSYVAKASGTSVIKLAITDSSNNVISGSGGFTLSAATSQDNGISTVFAYATPATLSAVTFKGRFASSAGSEVQLSNPEQSSQLYAIEVSA